MNLLINITTFLLNALVGVYLYFLIARLWMQKRRVSYFNPLSQAVIKMTDPLVKPCRRVFPGFRGYDLAVVFLIFALQYLLSVSLFAISRQQSMVNPWLVMIPVSVINIMLMLLNMLTIMLVVVAIISWIQSSRTNPVSLMLMNLVNPIMSRVRRVLPRMGGAIDFSPLVALLIIQVVRMIMYALLSSLQ